MRSLRPQSGARGGVFRRMALRLGAAAVLLAAAPAGGQDAPTRLEGVVTGVAGEPVAGAPVLLHRLDGASGATVAADTTDATGAFSLEVGEVGPEAVHFAAVRHAGTLFVGPVFEGTAIPSTYRIVVREGAPAGAVVMADGSILPSMGGGGAAPPARTRTPLGPEPPSPYLTLLAIGLVLTGLTLLALRVRDRRSRRERRELLLELAHLEETAAEASGAAEGADPRTARERDREALRARLRGGRG